MKWVALALALSFLAPLSVHLRKPGNIFWVCMAMGILPVLTQVAHLYMAAVSWPNWVGYCKGIEVSLLDVLAAAVFSSAPTKGETPPLWMPMAFYLGASMLSALQAAYPVAAIFYCWQIIRMMVVYAAVYRAVAYDPGNARALLIGMGFGEIFEAVLAAYQRFGLGVLQAHGSMESQNELGLVSHFTLFPFFAIMLGGRRGWLAPLVVLFCLFADVLTTSRGSVVLGFAGLAMTMALSMALKWSGRKAGIAVVGLLILVAVAPLAWASFEKRFSTDTNGIEMSEDAERLAYKRAVDLMIGDQPAGVGANHFALMGNIAGYYDRAGVAPYTSGRAGNVHNVYLLVLAETGYLGLATYLVMMLFPLGVALRYSFRHLDEARGDLLLGLGMTLLAVYIHSWEEWVTITFTMQYLLAINFGMISALALPYRARQPAPGHAPQAARLPSV